MSTYEPKKPGQQPLFPDPVAQDEPTTTVSLADMEHMLVRKYMKLERAGQYPAAAKVADQILKLKDMQQKDKAFQAEARKDKAKPTVLLIPIVKDLEEWEKLTKKHQDKITKEKGS